MKQCYKRYSLSKKNEDEKCKENKLEDELFCEGSVGGGGGGQGDFKLEL